MEVCAANLQQVVIAKFAFEGGLPSVVAHLAQG